MAAIFKCYQTLLVTFKLQIDNIVLKIVLRNGKHYSVY
jgi:hypothetical protein